MNSNNLSKENKILLLKYMEGFISENKSSLFDEIIQYRTRHITVVLEDIYQSQNASAVLRTCDCFGIQDINIIENKNKYEINPDVALGSSKWLKLNKYSREENNTRSCFDELKKQGYRIIATTPHKGDTMLEDLDISGKIALAFGTELAGLSDQAIELADGYLKIPMYGFTESFNISVSAAIILHHLTHKLRNSEISWMLTPEEMVDIRLDWVSNVLKRPDMYKKEFMNKHGLD